jgi:hypothetical protein
MGRWGRPAGSWGRTAFVLVALATTIGLVSCSSSDDDSSRGAQGAQDNAHGSEPASAGDVSLAELGRQVVSTASVRIEADDVADAKAMAVQVAQEAGGLMFAEQTRFGEEPQTTVTLKVPPDRLQGVLAELGSLGRVQDQDVSTEDVTERVVDLDSRIVTARASVERLRGFLDQTSSVSEIAQLEAELVQRESDLERLEGQRRAIGAQVALATITLTIQTPATVAAAELPGFLDGLHGGWEAFVAAATVVLAITGAVLPFVPIVVMILVVLRWLRRRPASVSSAGSGV